MNLAPWRYVLGVMPTARAPRANTHGWAIRLDFLGRTVLQTGRRDPAPLSAGEHPACDLVVPGLGERILLTDGDDLHLPPGLEGEVRVGGEVRAAADLRAASGRVRLVPGDGADLRLAAFPQIELSIRRVTLDRLPWSSRVHFRDLARQMITGAGLVALLAMLWRVESVENVLQLKGDPAGLDDTPLHRVMFFTPIAEPPEVVRARELFTVPVLPVAPPPPAAPDELGEDIVSSAPAPIPVLAVGPEAVPAPLDGAVELPAEPQAIRSKKVRKARHGEPESMGVLAVLSADDSVLTDTLIGEAFEGGVLGGVEGGVVGGVVGGVEGGVLGGHVGELKELSLETDRPQPRPAGVHSHDAQGADASRGAADGVAAVAFAAACDDPTVSKKKQIDVVFAVDVSTTMNFMLGKIEQEIAAVDAEVRAQGLDARYGLVVFVDDVQIANGGQPYADLAALQRDLAQWQAFTASNRQIGSTAANLDWPENTLDALYTAADGFAWRPADTTLRAIVHATDDDFGEAPAVQSGQTIQHGYRQTVAALRAAEVRVFSFAARVGGQCECLDVRPGLMAPYRGQKAIPAATGGAVFDIDEVAAGRLGFGKALSGALSTAICTHYPLSPFGGKK